MERHIMTELATSPHDTAIHGLGDLGHIIIILLFVAMWVIVAFLVFLGGVFIVEFIKDSPAGAIICFLIIGAVATVVGALIFASWGWGVILLFGAGAGIVGTAIMAMHDRS